MHELKQKYYEAERAVQYIPPPELREALKSAVVMHGLSIKGLIAILDALKSNANSDASVE